MRIRFLVTIKTWNQKTLEIRNLLHPLFYPLTKQPSYLHQR